MLLIETLLFFIIFIFLSFFVFYIIGLGIISEKKKILEDQEIIVISLSLGIILFVLLATLLGILHLRFLMLPITILSCLAVLLRRKKEAFSPWKLFFVNKLLSFLIILGILIQGFTIFSSGYLYNNGLNFWSSEGHDGLWHVSVMEAIKKSIPPQNPVFSHELLYNYHYLVDVLMGEFGRIFPFFSSLDLYFRFFPILFSFLIGMSVFAFVSRWQNSKKIGCWAIFFTYFVGSFGFIVALARGGNIFSGETLFWAAQENTLVDNPPHAISHCLLTTFFLIFLIYLKERKIFWLLAAFLVGSTLAGFKISAGFVMLAGLIVASIIDFINTKRLSTIILTALLGSSNFLTFKLMTSPDATSFLIFMPWWFIRTMVVERLGWIDLEHKRQFYLARHTWQAFLRIVQIESTAFLIFLVGNLGMRIFGLFELIKKFILNWKTAFRTPVDLMLIVTMLAGIIMPLLFVQKGIAYNSIQFIQYFLFVFGFYGAIFTYRMIILFKNPLFRLIFIGLVVCLSIPTVIGNIRESNWPFSNPTAEISNSEIIALQYLKQNSPPDAVILNKPFDAGLKYKFKYQPQPIYAWYDTPYISALTARSSYLSSEEATLLFYPTTDQRMENKRKFFEQSDFSWNRNFLKEVHISYIYIAKGELSKPLNLKENALEIFFENNAVVIYRVRS